MTKKFIFTKVLKSYYDSSLQEYAEDTESIEYEVSRENLENAIIDIVFTRYFKILLKQKKLHIENIKCLIKKFIDGHDLYNQLIDDLEEDIKDFFEEEVLNILGVPENS